MELVRIETKDQLKEMIEWVFFRPEGAYNHLEESVELSCEEIMEAFGISENDIVTTEAALYSDEWYELIDLVDGDTLKQYILVDEKIGMLSDFKPGVLLWKNEDSFDRHGTVTTRIFVYTPDDEISFEAFKIRQQAWQEQYDKEVELAGLVEQAIRDGII